MMRAFVFFFAVMVFAPTAFAAVEGCGDADVTHYVERIVADPIKSEQTQAILRQIEVGISKGLLKPQQKETAIAAFIEFAVRHERQCSMPQDLRSRISSVIALTKDGAQACDTGKFDTTISRQHKSLKAADGYGLFEGVIKSQIEANVIPSARARFIDRWDTSSGFREQVIKAGLLLNVMFMHDCANLQDPILDILTDF